MPIIFTSLGHGLGALEPQAFYVQTYVLMRPVTPPAPTPLEPRPPLKSLPDYGPPPLVQTWTWRQVHMLGRDQLPVGDQITDLTPQRYVAYRIEQTTAWRQVGMLGQDQLPVGNQITALPSQLPYQIDQTAAWNWTLLYGPVVVTGPLGVILNQYDWPLPRAPYRIDQTWVWNQLPMLGQDYLLAGEQSTDLTPKAPPRLSYYGWEWNQLRMLGQDRLPAGKQIHDLTAHRFVPFRPEQTWTWRQVGMLGKDILLFGDQIYDLPPKAPQRLSDYTWSWNQVGMLGQDRLPKNQYDWPLPSRGPYKIEQTTTWRQVGMLGQDVLPKNQYDWPLPNRGPYKIEQTTTWRQVQMLGLDQLPVGEQVYDLPVKAPLRPVDLYTWVQSVNLALNTTPAVLPLNQYDWPLPQPQPRPALSWTWRQVDKIGRDRLPRNQYDWPLPNRGPAQFVRSWEWRQVGMLGRDQLPPGDQIFDLPNRGVRLALYDWIQSVNLALNVKPTFPFNQFDWPLPNRGPAQPDRSYTFRSQFIPPVPPFIGAQYFLLQPHYVNNAFLDAWTTVTEGHEVPIGWIPTLMVDPLNEQAVAAFYDAGPRRGYPGPGYDWQGYQGFTARRTAAIQSPITYWTDVGPGQFKLTGLGSSLPPKAG